MTDDLSVTHVPVGTLPIAVGAFLKVAGLVRSGGEAKSLCLEGRVAVNGQVETRRGRTLNAGDVVALTDDVRRFRVTVAEHPYDAP